MMNLLIEEDRLFLIKDMVLAEPIGCIFLEVDLDSMYQMLELTETEAPVYLYDEKGDLIGTRQNMKNAPERMDFSRAGLWLTDSMQCHGGEEWYWAAGRSTR